MERNKDNIAQWRREQTVQRRLVCPYCGSDLNLGSFDGTISCREVRRCGAQWNIEGVSTQTPAKLQASYDRALARLQPHI